MTGRLVYEDRDDLLSALEVAEAALGRVEALHESIRGIGGDIYCNVCRDGFGSWATYADWPCPTVAALRGDVA